MIQSTPEGSRGTGAVVQHAFRSVINGLLRQHISLSHPRRRVRLNILVLLMF